MQDFIADMVRGARRVAELDSTSTACAAPTSMGSPNDVPVPCISSSSTALASMLAVRRALRMARCWEGPLGAVRELDRPSWFTADATSDPECTTTHASPSPPRSSARSSSTTHASPRT